MAADAPVQTTESQALNAARQSGGAVEVGALRGETREIYAEPDGTFTAVQHVRPVRTRQQGRWVAIDTTLRRLGSGEVAPVASAEGLRLSGGGTGPMIRIARAGRELSLTWPGTLPVPSLSGDTATYSEVAAGIDLKLRAEPDGVTSLVVVKTSQAARNPLLTSLGLSLGTSGLRVQADGQGQLTAVDAGSGGAVFAAPQPLMWDSAGASLASPASVAGATANAVDPTDGPLDGSKVVGVRTSVSAGKVTLEPDQSLLTAADTKWPVYIDPAWRTETESAWAMVSSGYPSQSYYKFSGKSTEGVGYCDVNKDGSCVKSQTKRIFFRIPTAYFAGKTILSAQFTAWETFAYDCSADREVELWRTYSFSSSSTWNSTSDSWRERLDSRYVSYCSSTPVEFNAKAAVVEAAAGKWSSTAFGLKAGSESTMAYWKRFADDAALRVNYNRAPYQPKMSQLSMSPGGACVDPSKQPWVNKKPTLYAKGLTDADGDRVSAQFFVGWDGGSWTSPTIGPKASGGTNVFSVNLGASGGPVIPQNVQLHWQVRVSDGTAWSPWSYSGNATSCYFKYDATVPAGPAIASADGRYPRSDPVNENDLWHDGVGRYGTFTLDSAATDVTRYWYGINGDPIPANERATTGGAPVTISLMPSQAGLFFLTAKAFDSAGNVSQTEIYYFRVKAGSAPTAAWKFDESGGSTTVAGTTPGIAADLTGGATLGGTGAVGTALSLDGATGYGSTSLPVVNTGQSFTISAWTRLRSVGMYNVLAQDGVLQSGFQLGVNPTGKLVFKMPAADVAGDGTWSSAVSTSTAQLNTWTHLIGVYDGAAKQLKLYVNGQPNSVASNVTAWNAGGGLQIGRSLFDGAYHNYWPGDVDDIKVFGRAISDTDAQALAANRNPSGTAAMAHWTLDESAGERRVYGDPNDVSASVRGGVTLGVPGQDGSAMRLDGTTGYAQTASPVVNASQSFTVSAWVRMNNKTAWGWQTLVSQDGPTNSAFFLQYSQADDRWSMSAGGVRALSAKPPALGEWAHVVGVYDTATKQVQLYVNGVLQGVKAISVPWAKENGSMAIGRAKANGANVDFFAGDIDDVRVFDRVVSATEVSDLFLQHPVVAGRWKLNTDGADDSGLGHLVAFGGDAHVDGAAGLFGSPPGALVLDGAGDYAATTGPVVSTNESFTVAGWVITAGRPTANTAVFSQAGSVNSGFTLRYSPSAVGGLGGYEIEMPTADTSGASTQKADHSSFQSALEWDHIAIVYDAFQDEMRLYVNGQLEQVEDGSRESYRLNTVGFNATGGLQLGRSKTNGVWGEYWPGALDDVWAFSGALNEEQIQGLTGTGEELPTRPS
ncbi:LamG domain-containing protein [Nonomuraea sp. M3C6]|uniref:LamG domain-containing protein n=1 Tax=Nonomuraea marmarensis TaxID=3351344 RepID=A0ABW7AUG2_9ACTN